MHSTEAGALASSGQNCSAQCLQAAKGKMHVESDTMRCRLRQCMGVATASQLNMSCSGAPVTDRLSTQSVLIGSWSRWYSPSRMYRNPSGTMLWMASRVNRYKSLAAGFPAFASHLMFIESGSFRMSKNTLPLISLPQLGIAITRLTRFLHLQPNFWTL